ncbi:hypothetical protein QE380_003704 [Acinetobacter baylyi]|uniref:Uncharacterized protein n=1 Tax=Acinetobacter baylyi TaxID=202950 RepID=A0ABU0V1I6_ACIBI|nr:hypothetical protein J527_2477 [Acinetobacter baumannii 1267820]MDQ1210685.1 hypothetical protein [Acinetobacter baylyi]MDR6104738.1 hypothetical protein [Acinetobacter baylyi]MDR6187710.1 hypothetical protein [Acinetobacter baylyi]MDR6187725.1 hypothetical protein [Acinetobacter baylyi]
MHDFFAMVVTLAKHFKDRPEVLLGLVVVLGGITLIWTGKLKGAISFGG